MIWFLLLILTASFHVNTSDWIGLDPCLDEINCTGIRLNINVSDPEDCSQYFLCAETALYPRSCPRGYEFDQNIAVCLDPRTVLLIHCGNSCPEVDYKQYIVYPSSGQPTMSVVRNETTTPSTSSMSIHDQYTSILLTTTSAISSSQTTPSASEILSYAVENAISTTISNLKITSQFTNGSIVSSTISKTQTATVTSLSATDGTTVATSSLANKETTTTRSKPISLLASIYNNNKDTTAITTSTLKDETTTMKSTTHQQPTTTAENSTDMPTNQTVALISLADSVPTKSENYSETTTLGLSTNTQTTTLNSFARDDTTTIIDFPSSSSSNNTLQADERRITTDAKSTTKVLDQAALSTESFEKTVNIQFSTTLDTSTVAATTTTNGGSSTANPSTVSTSTISLADLWKLCNRENPCSPGDRFGDVVDCSTYFECVTFLGSATYLMPMACPYGQVFNPFTKYCDRRSAENGDGTGICFGSICEMRISHTVSVFPVPALSGHPLTVRCSFRVLFVVQPIQVSEFIWQLNGYPLSSAGTNQRIQIGPMVWDDQGFWNSTLTFKPITTRDSGTIDCIVKYGTRLTSVNSTGYIDVQPTPTIEIYPLNAVVVRNESIALMCKAAFGESVSKNATSRISSDFVFSWFRLNQRINIKNDSDCIASANTASASTIVCRPTNDAEYFCRVNYSSGYSDSRSSSIKVVKDSSLLCKSDNTDGVEWSSVMVNTTCVVSCASTSTGFMTRKCNFDGKSAVWNEPDSSACVDKELNELLSKVRDVRQGISINSSETTGSIAEGLRKYLSSLESDLNFGNFNTSLAILRELGSIQSAAWNITKPGIVEIKSVLWSTSSLLNSTNEFLWKNLTAQNTFGAIPIMEVVDVYGKKWAKSLTPGNSDTIRYEYLAMSAVCEYSTKILNLSFPTFNSSDEQDWTNTATDRIYFQNPSELQDNDTETLYYISSSIYRNLNEYFPTTTDASNSSHVTLGSRIVSLTIDGLSNSNNLSNPVEIVLEDFETPSENTIRKCVLWDTESSPSGSWSDNRCRLRSVSSSKPKTTICECDHLTNFAILFSLSPAEGRNIIILAQISIIGCIVSIASLGFLLLLFAVRWKRVRSHHAVVLVNLCIALLAANIVFLAGVDKTADKVACTVVAVLLHYFFLAAFCVMLIEGIQLLLYVARPFYVHRKRDTTVLLIVAWAIPLTIVGVSLAVTRTEGYGGSDSCWLSTKNNLLWAFVGPALAIIMANFTILVIVLVNIARTKRSSEQTTKQRVWATAWNVFIIVPILGVTWVFGVFSVNQDLVAFQYIFIIANSFQGFFIFLFHGLCHKKNSNSKRLAQASIRQMWDTPLPTPSPPPSPPPRDPPKHVQSASRGVKTRVENHWRRLSRRHAVNWAAIAAAAVASSSDGLELQDGDGDDGECEGIRNGTMMEEPFSRSMRPPSSQSVSVATPSKTSTDRTDILF